MSSDLNIKTGDGIYEVKINSKEKTLSVDFIPNKARRDFKVDVLRHIPFNKYMYTRDGAVFVLLDDGRYIYIGCSIFELPLFQNDMMVRLVSSKNPVCCSLMTRFNTYIITENNLYTVRDGQTNTPVEIRLHFDSTDLEPHKLTEVTSTIIHNGFVIRKLHRL